MVEETKIYNLGAGVKQLANLHGYRSVFERLGQALEQLEKADRLGVLPPIFKDAHENNLTRELQDLVSRAAAYDDSKSAYLFDKEAIEDVLRKP